MCSMTLETNADSARCDSISVEKLLHEAQQGASDRLGQLLQHYRNYLQVVAMAQLDPKLRARISASDLVQETMLGAYRDFPQFRGHSERELLAWLRQILINKLRVFVQQHVLAARRDVRRERSLNHPGDSSASSGPTRGEARLADRGPSPSTDCVRRETAVQLADYLARMPQPYRDVVVLRNFCGLPFDDVAERMQRSSGAVRMLWLRAISQLRAMMEPENEACLTPPPSPLPSWKDCRVSSSNG
jgi:RNA polymerase sigma-70 factor (ECF subfamily)